MLVSVRSATAAALLAACALPACVAPDEDEDLGDVGDGKSDAPGILDKAFTVSAGKTRRFTFTAESGFEVRVRPDSEPMPLIVTVRSDGMQPVEDVTAAIRRAVHN